MRKTDKVSALLLILSFTFIILASVLLFSNPFQQSSPTGFAVGNSSGNITVVVDDTISIVLLDSGINFGNCTLDQSRVNIFDSGNSNSTGDNANCEGIYTTNVDYIQVENDGNVNVNLTLATNVTANDIFLISSSSSTNSMYSYKGPTLALSCQGGTLQSDWNNLTVNNTYYPICDNFSFVDSSDDLKIAAMIYVNGSATIGGRAKWTFQASSI